VPIFISLLPKEWGTQQHSWLRQCTTIQKVMGSNPDGVNGIFQWLNPSGRTVALGSSQPLTGMSIRGISWRERQPVKRADNLATYVCQLSRNSGSLNLLESQGPVQACTGTALLYFSRMGTGLNIFIVWKEMYSIWLRLNCFHSTFSLCFNFYVLIELAWTSIRAPVAASTCLKRVNSFHFVVALLVGHVILHELQMKWKLLM
jgi:hypothetical protein